MRSVFARLVSNVVDAMTGSPAIIAGLFIYLLWVVPHGVNGKSGFAAALSLSVMMLPVVTPGRAGGHHDRTRLAARGRSGPRSTAMAGRRSESSCPPPGSG